MPVRSRRWRTRWRRSTSATRSACGSSTAVSVRSPRPTSAWRRRPNAVIVGFNVRPQGKATELADREGVDIRYYSVIYAAIDEIEAALKGMLKPIYEEATLGQAEIREIFRSSKRRHHRGLHGHRRHDPAQLQGPAAARGRRRSPRRTIASLRREKDDATEVREGFECGMTLAQLLRHPRSATSSRPSRCGRRRAASVRPRPAQGRIGPAGPVTVRLGSAPNRAVLRPLAGRGWGRTRCRTVPYGKQPRIGQNRPDRSGRWPIAADLRRA